MTEHPPTPSEIKARVRNSKLKPRKVPVKCTACTGTGEIATPGQHAARCPTCLGSGMAQLSKDQQVDGILFSRSTF